MTALLAVLGVLAIIAIFVIRARKVEQHNNKLMDTTPEIREAARRYGFSRQAKTHPVDSIRNPDIATGAIAAAFREMDVLPTREQRDAMIESFGFALNIGAEDAQDLATLGHWLVAECGGPQPAIPRLARRLLKLKGDAAFQPLLDILNATLAASSSAVNDQQKDALSEVKQIFRSA